MPRIRTIKPEIWEDEAIGASSLPARLLFIGLITQADDEGRLKGDPRIIRAQVFPYEETTTEQVHELLTELSLRALVTLYENNGRRFIALSSWQDHQKVNRPTRSRLPGPFDDDSVIIHGGLTEDSPPDQGSGIRDQGSGIREKSSAENPSEPPRDKRKNPDDVNQPPSEFSETLLPIAEQCVEVLQRIAVAKKAKTVTLLAVCRAMESYPNRQFVKVAGDLEHWCLHGNGAKKPARDVVARWRNFLDGEPETAQPSANGEHRFSAYDAKIRNREKA